MTQILIVEDEQSLREGVAEVLELEGYTVLSAENGQMALDLLNQHQPDLIVCDIMMPELDGYEFLTRVRQNPRLNTVPFIFLTAKVSHDDQRHGMNLGADDYLTKPFDPDELISAVEARLERHQSMVAPYEKALQEAKSEQERIRQCLDEAAEQFRRFIRLSPDGVLMIDLKGIIHLANPAMLRMLRADQRDHVVKHPIRDVLVAEEVSTMTAYLQDVIGNPEHQGLQFETQFLRQDGTTFLAEVTMGYFEFGDIAAAQLIVRDVTERRRVEAELRALNEHKNRFFSILAHDLRNPFTVLLGSIELLMENIDDFDKTEIKRLAETMDISANTVFRLLENLLQWSRIQMGRMEIDPAPLDLAVIATLNLELVRESAQAKQIQLINQITTEIPAYGDMNMIDTVIRNLLTNAIKFTPPGGNVTITAQVNGNTAELSVSDTGIGISP
ncbi:MAG: hybrid sensor histidine kinase/response regulator, partial [Gemmatimonadetes bacterium]